MCFPSLTSCLFLSKIMVTKLWQDPNLGSKNLFIQKKVVLHQRISVDNSTSIKVGQFSSKN